MGANSLPKTVNRQRRSCDLNLGLLRLVQHANHSATEPPYFLLLLWNIGYVTFRLLS